LIIVHVIYTALYRVQQCVFNGFFVEQVWIFQIYKISQRIQLIWVISCEKKANANLDKVVSMS